jgi:hypothetical protein
LNFKSTTRAGPLLGPLEGTERLHGLALQWAPLGWRQLQTYQDVFASSGASASKATAFEVPPMLEKMTTAPATAFEGKTCHLCWKNDDGPGYDLWHVLFECPKTTNESAMTRVRRECQRLVTDISNRIQVATANNAASMASTAHAGVDHAAIGDAATIVIRIAQKYDWNCLPVQWLMHCMLLALPFSEKAVCPPIGSQLPTLPASQYSLPLSVGRLFDATVLSSDALRPLADEWCRRVVDCLRAAGRLVTLLRAAAEERREQAKAAARAGAPVQTAPEAHGPGRRRQKSASAAAQTAARAARAAPPATGRSSARAHVGIQGAARTARTAPSTAGRR